MLGRKRKRSQSVSSVNSEMEAGEATTTNNATEEEETTEHNITNLESRGELPSSHEGSNNPTTRNTGIVDSSEQEIAFILDGLDLDSSTNDESMRRNRITGDYSIKVHSRAQLSEIERYQVLLVARELGFNEVF